MSSADDSRRSRHGYYRRVELAIVAAAALHAVVFVLAPPYVPRPYRLYSPPLRLVSAASDGRGLGGTAGLVAPQSPAAEASRALRPAVVVTEQLQLAPSLPPSRGTSQTARPDGTVSGAGGTGGSGGAGGAAGIADGVEPPVFYAFDSPPKLTRRVEPEYPAAARAQGLSGTVIVNANVDEHGRIMRVWVVQSTAPEMLIQAAIDAVYQFEFSPGSERGIPVKCTVAIPFTFSLNQSL